MSLKQKIKRSQLIAQTPFQGELVLPGEPLIYSIKYKIGQRKHEIQFFRNNKWKSLLKCFFRSYYNTKIPLVLFVKFFVSPPTGKKIRVSDLKKEKLPATHSFELCDYLLSFLDMLMHVLFNSYRQLVKIDVEKYYSSNPRTTFKFMKWDHYVMLQNNNTLHTETETVSKTRRKRVLQSELQRHVEDARICKEIACRQETTNTFRAVTSDNPLPNPFTEELTESHKIASGSITSHEAT